MKGLLAVVAAIALAAGVTATTAGPASADVTDPNMLSVDDGVAFEYCNGVPYSLKPLSDWGSAQSQSMGGSGWYVYQVTLTVIGPDGTEADRDTLSRLPNDTPPFGMVGRDTGTFLVCDGAGTYTVQVSGYWCSGYGTPETTPDRCQNVAFQRAFSLLAPETKTELTGSRSYHVSERPLKVKATVDVQRPTGMSGLRDASVKLQYREGGRWVTYDDSYTKRSGRVSFDVELADPGTFRFRAVTSSSEYYKGSRSRVLRVRVSR